jgi:N-acetylglucosamine-6-sulfatase
VAVHVALVRSLAVLAAATLAVVVAVAGHDEAATAQADQRPNIVFVLTDDLTWNLVRFMPSVQRMQREGMTFTNYFVTDSLCCPSRASIFSGRYPHNHGVLTNTAPDGGFAGFSRGAESRTFATSLQGAGYRTAMMGKYLNGYRPKDRYVPPGWNDWQVPGNGYGGFRYVMNSNGRTAHFGKRRRAYLTDVLRRRGTRFVGRAARAHAPFLLELATFAPHRPYTPAPRNRFDFPGLQAPRTPAFDRPVERAPAWLRDRPPLTPDQITNLDDAFRKRAQSVEAVDQMIGRIREELHRTGLDRSTYVFFSSDNGLHMGEHTLAAGKMTAFDTDIRVPLIVVGPHVPPGSVNRRLTENIDLAPTFMRLGGVTPPRSVDGRALVGLLHGAHPGAWRDAVLIEHHHPTTPSGDPDHQTPPSGNPPSYEALRTATETYVEYADGEREYYDLLADPYELRNSYAELPGWRRAELHAELIRLESCSGAGCRRIAAG